MRPILSLPLALALAAPALAQPFTYQGRLTTSGQPAAGQHQVELRVFDDPNAGGQLGLTTSALVTPLADGTFTMQADPGPGVFTGSPRWIELAVRPAGVGPFTTLAPRQPLTPTPYALRALNEWLVPSGASNLTLDPSRTRLFINRADRLNISEYFGLTAPTPDFTFGGMYVNTTGLNGLPFYGYSTGDGARTARTYYIGSTQSWIVDIGGDRLRVQSDGNVRIGPGVANDRLDVAGGNVRADAFRYTSPRTRYASISGSAFQPGLSTNTLTREVAASGTFHDAAVASASLYAPVNLPHGCVLTQVEFFVLDNTASASVTGRLYRRPHGSFGIISVASTPSTSGTSTIIQNLSLAPNLTIDNFGNAYYLAVDCGDWQGGSTSVFSARLTYTLTDPD